MGGNKKGNGFMQHDPLADVGDLPSVADDILEGELLPADDRDSTAKSAESPAEAGTPEGNALLDLGDTLTIRDVADVHDRLLTALQAGGQAFVFKAAALEQVDGAGLQMLAAFMREANLRGATVDWDQIPDCLREGAAHIGMTELLGLA